MAEEDFFSLLLSNHIGGGSGMPPDEQQQQQRFLQKQQRRSRLQQRGKQRNEQHFRGITKSNCSDGSDVKDVLQRQVRPPYHASTAAHGAVEAGAANTVTASAERWQLLQGEQVQQLQRSRWQTGIDSFLERQRGRHPLPHRQKQLQRHRQRILSRQVIARCKGDSQPISRTSSSSNDSRRSKYSKQRALNCSSRLRRGSCTGTARRRNSSITSGSCNKRGTVSGKLRRSSREPHCSISAGTDDTGRGQKPARHLRASSSCRCSNINSSRSCCSRRASSRSLAGPWVQQQHQDAKEQHEMQSQQQKQQRLQQQGFHSDSSRSSEDSFASLISRSRRLLLGGSRSLGQQQQHIRRQRQPEQLLQPRRPQSQSRLLQSDDLAGWKERQTQQQNHSSTNRSTSCRSFNSTNNVSRKKDDASATRERNCSVDSPPESFRHSRDPQDDAGWPEQQQRAAQQEGGGHRQQQQEEQGKKLRDVEDAIRQARLLLQQQQQQQQKLKELQAQQLLLQKQQLHHQKGEKELREWHQELQQDSREQQQRQRVIVSQQQQKCLTAAAAAAVGALQQQLQLLRVLLQHNLRDAARWMENSLMGFKSICDRQVGAAAAAAAQAAAAHDIQKQELQKSITLLQLELQSTVGAKQQQEKLVETLRAQQEEQREAAAAAAAQEVEERLRHQHSMHQQYTEQIQELQCAHQKKIQEVQQQHQRQLQQQLLQQQQAARSEREQLQQQLQEAQEALETLRLQREDEKAEKDKLQRAEAAELRRMKESNILLRQQMQQQEQQIQQQQQQLNLLHEQTEKDAQERREKQQQQEQQMLQAVAQLNAAASHKEARLQSLQREKEADKLQLEREKQMVLLQSEELEEARQRLAAAISQQQQQQQTLHEQQHQLLRLQRQHQQQKDEIATLQQQLQQLQQQNEAAEREHEERYAHLQAESSQRLQQLLQQEKQLRREIAAQRELFRKGSSSTDELLLAKHELTTLKHELQELLAEETGKREALHRQNEQQKQEIATKQQLLRCLMQEKAALEAQLSQLQQQQQQQEQQYKDACKQHVAQTLQLQQQREEEQQKTQQLQGKLEQQQQELLLQQQKLGCLARQNKEKEHQMLLLRREEAALYERLDSESATATKLREALSTAQQTVQQQRQQLLQLQQACMKGGERVDEELLKQTNPNTPAVAGAMVAAAIDTVADPSASSLTFDSTKAKCVGEAVVTDALTVNRTTDSTHSLGAVLLQKLPREILDPSTAKDDGQQQQKHNSEAPKQSRQSSADTCDTELHADGNSSGCSIHAAHEEQSNRRSSSSSSIRTRSAGSDRSNCISCGSSKFRSSFSLFRRRGKTRRSDMGCSTEVHSQQPLQPEDTPRFGPAAYLLQKLSNPPLSRDTEKEPTQQPTEASAGSLNMGNACGSKESSGGNHLAVLQRELSGVSRSIFAARKRMRQVQQQRQNVWRQRQILERQQQKRQQEEAEIYELLARQSCCCEIAYQDLLQQSIRFASAVRNKQKLEAAAAALAPPGDPAFAATECVAANIEARADDAAHGHFEGFFAASQEADNEEALRILLGAAGRSKVRAAIQYWTREASSAKWILQRAHAERDTAANTRQDAQQQLQQLQQRADAERQQLHQLQQEELALQSEEMLCGDELRNLASKEQQLLLQSRQGHNRSSSRSCSRVLPSRTRTHSSNSSRSSSKSGTGGSRSASAEPHTRSSCSRAKCSELPSLSSSAASDDGETSSGRGLRALDSLEKLLQQHSMFPVSPSLAHGDPDVAAEAAAAGVMDTEHSRSTFCSFWVQLEDSSGL